MECPTCKTKMVCYDDVNDMSVRIDWVRCPKCDSKAEIQYGQNGKYIEKINWNRQEINIGGDIQPPFL